MSLRFLATTNPRNPLRYASVALMGLIIDATIVTLALWAGLGAGLATLLGYTLALIGTYLVNEHSTLDAATKRTHRFALYASICATTGIVRALIVVGLVGWSTPLPIAWAIGVLFSFVTNYTLLRRLFWHATPSIRQGTSSLPSHHR